MNVAGTIVSVNSGLVVSTQPQSGGALRSMDARKAVVHVVLNKLSTLFKEPAVRDSLVPTSCEPAGIEYVYGPAVQGRIPRWVVEICAPCALYTWR